MSALPSASSTPAARGRGPTLVAFYSDRSNVTLIFFPIPATREDDSILSYALIIDRTPGHNEVAEVVGQRMELEADGVGGEPCGMTAASTWNPSSRRPSKSRLSSPLSRYTRLVPMAAPFDLG